MPRFTNQERNELLDEIRGLREQLKTARDQSRLQSEYEVTSASVQSLKKQLVDLEISKDKLKEQNDREIREVKHMVGLEKKRQEFEVESAKREALLAVREENLQNDRNRFEAQMKFHEKRFSEEVGYLKDLLDQIMSRMPNASMSWTHNTAPAAPEPKALPARSRATKRS